jgi:hypothetical protein
MKFFIDTANLAQNCAATGLRRFRRCNDKSILMAKEGIGKNNILKHHVAKYVILWKVM